MIGVRGSAGFMVLSEIGCVPVSTRRQTLGRLNVHYALTCSKVSTWCATDAASSPSHRPGRDRVRRSANLLGSDHQLVASLVQRKVVPSRQRRCNKAASLRASATFAFLAPLRLASLSAQALRDDQRSTLVSRTFAASNR